MAVTTIGGRIFPKFEAMALVLHIIGFFAILITLVYLAPKNSPKEVFQSFLNGGEFSTDAQSWFVGTVSVMFTFIGETFLPLVKHQCVLTRHRERRGFSHVQEEKSVSRLFRDYADLQ